MSNLIERVAPNDPRLPPNLLLPEPVEAEILPDGRAVPVNLPPGARAFHYPDLPVEAGVVAPSFAEPTETPTDTLLTSEAQQVNEPPVAEESVAQTPEEATPEQDQPQEPDPISTPAETEADPQPEAEE